MRLSGDVAGVVGAEEGAGCGDVVGGSCAPHGGAGDDGGDVGQVAAVLGAVQHRCLDEPGRDGVDRDAVRCQFERERFGNADDAALGRDVVRHARRAGLGAGGGDGDDAAPAAGQHVGHDGLQAVEGAGQIDRHDAVPCLEGDFGERRRRVDTGAGDHDLDGPEVVANDRQRSSTSVRSLTSTVRCDGAVTVRVKYVSASAAGVVAVAVEQCDPIADGGESLGDGPAHPDTAPVTTATRPMRLLQIGRLDDDVERDEAPESGTGAGATPRPGTKR